MKQRPLCYGLNLNLAGGSIHIFNDDIPPHDFVMTASESTLNSNYEKLIGKAKRSIVLDSATSIIDWDLETMMPPKGIALRSEQLGLLSRIGHQMSTDPEIGQLINLIRGHPNYQSFSEAQRRNVYLIKKQYDEQTKLPEELVA
ncbi:MAG: hypothetical protein V1857_04410, partial [archaeon]